MTEIAAWELAVSLAMLAISIIGALLLSVKASRAYMLVYGKRPNWGEIIYKIGRMSTIGLVVRNQDFGQKRLVESQLS